MKPDIVLLALFADIEPAASALHRLRAEQEYPPSSLMVMSSVPFPEGVLDVERPRSLLPALTVICALIGIGLGLLLAGGTAALYVLRTGAKPIESGPPIGIIAYEAMMLIALTGAFMTALWEMRLPGWQAKVYDRRIAEGLIGIAVRCSGDEDAAAADNLIRSAGAVDVRRDSRSLE